jgi:2-polyprenyl-3-methyl-5-hydroxy-6-metoxy-1,4-benzoquinol methylase
MPEYQMDIKQHCKQIYDTKSPTEVSWFSPHLGRSLVLIERVCPDRTSSLIDLGGGESTLVDDLLSRGYENVTVLDIAQSAIDYTRARLGAAGHRVTWLVADVTQANLPEKFYDLWHDRAVFHFLTEPAQRQAYVRQVASSVKPGGHVIVATFGPEGPRKCSGLDVMRYDADSLHSEFGHRFHLVESSKEMHHAPWGTEQQFLYCYCVLE